MVALPWVPRRGFVAIFHAHDADGWCRHLPSRSARKRPECSGTSLFSEAPTAHSAPRDLFVPRSPYTGAARLPETSARPEFKMPGKNRDGPLAIVPPSG